MLKISVTYGRLMNMSRKRKGQPGYIESTNSIGRKYWKKDESMSSKKKDLLSQDNIDAFNNTLLIKRDCAVDLINCNVGISSVRSYSDSVGGVDDPIKTLLHIIYNTEWGHEVLGDNISLSFNLGKSTHNAIFDFMDNEGIEYDRRGKVSARKFFDSINPDNVDDFATAMKDVVEKQRRIEQLKSFCDAAVRGVDSIFSGGSFIKGNQEISPIMAKVTFLNLRNMGDDYMSGESMLIILYNAPKEHVDAMRDFVEGCDYLDYQVFNANELYYAFDTNPDKLTEFNELTKRFSPYS